MLSKVVVKPKRQRKKGKKRRSESAAATPDAFEGSQDARMFFIFYEKKF